MGKGPDQIRNEIEHTRQEMSETVGALGRKANVPGRAKESVSGMKDRVVQAVEGTKTSAQHEAGALTSQARHKGQQAVGIAQENPLGLAVGSVAAGFLLGMVVPSTKVEKQKIGPVAQDVKQKAMETGREAAERGRHVAEETMKTAQEEANKVAQDVKGAARHTSEEAKQVTKDESQKLSSSAQQKAQEVSSKH